MREPAPLGGPYIFNDCGCCLNPTVAFEVNIKGVVEAKVTVALRDGRWYQGASIQTLQGSFSGHGHSPCTNSQRTTFDSPEGAMMAGLEHIRYFRDGRVGLPESSYAHLLPSTIPLPFAI